MTETAHERITVNASPDAVYQVAIDFENYPSWVKDVKSAAILDTDDEGRGLQVEYRAAALGRSMRYVLEYEYDEAPAAFSWKLVEGDMLRRLDGKYALAADGDGTRITYDLAVELSIPLPGLIKRRASGLIMGSALRELKKECERSHS